MTRHPDDPDWAWDDNPERTHWDHEEGARRDRFDGYGDPGCDDDANFAYPDYDVPNAPPVEPVVSLPPADIPF